MMSILKDIKLKTKDFNQVMSLKIHRHIEANLEKNQNLFNAQVISFPNDKKLNNSKELKINTHSFWKISDKSNED